MLFFSLALLPAIASCGGASVAATAQQAALAGAFVNPCDGFVSTAVAGAVVAVSASDAAAFPSATSCTEAAALRNGAIVVAKGVPQGQIDMLVGLDAGDIESGSTAVNATAFAIDGDGALEELVAIGDPSQTQGEIDQWIADRGASAASRRIQSVGSGLAAAWTTMFTQQVVTAGSGSGTSSGDFSSGLSRSISIYRLNSSDFSYSWFLVTNKIITRPNRLPCTGTACARVMLSRSTIMDAGNDALDEGPPSSDAPTASITIGNALTGGDAASGVYAISWPQPNVEEHDLTYGSHIMWQENFPNVFPTETAPVLPAAARSAPAASTPISFSSTNGFTSYSAAIFPGPANSYAGKELPFTVRVISSAQVANMGMPTVASTDTLTSTFAIHRPNFSINNLRLTADNGNGGVLRWKLVSVPIALSVAPSAGSGSVTLRITQVGPIINRESLTFDTVPPHAAAGPIVLAL